jgi:hypothetical protein
MTDSLTCQQLRALLSQQVASIQSLQDQLNAAVLEYNSLTGDSSPDEWRSIGNRIATLSNSIGETQSAISHTVQQMGQAGCM